jgi:hypothetical protein
VTLREFARITRWVLLWVLLIVAVILVPPFVYWLSFHYG